MLGRLSLFTEYFFQLNDCEVTDGSAMTEKQLHISGKHGFDCMLDHKPVTHQSYYFRSLEENYQMSMKMK